MQSPTRARRGAVYIESVIAITLALSAMGAVAQLVAASSRQRHEAERIRVAGQEVANVLENVMAQPWSEIESNMAVVGISAGAADLLEQTELRVVVDRTGDAIATKRIRVECTWVNDAGERVQPVVLTAWKHRRAAAP